ncbi:MAG: S8 family serine peptidase [Flavobacteriales bacterium]|nr:S8 family serine peptidase [Flavobacteriales bacterium]
MKNLFVLALWAYVLTAPFALHAQDPEYVPGDILIMLEPGFSPNNLEEDLAVFHDQRTTLRVVEEVSAPMRIWLLHYEQPAIPQPVMLREVARHPAVMIAQNNHIVQDRTVPDDTQYGQQWHHQNIASEAAWDLTTGGVTATGDTIVVCIVENSDLPHPDLIGNAWYNFLEIPNNGIDDDANGYVDDFEGWNPGGNNDNVYGGGHGTQVAGMIGAKGNNNLGVAGANWNVKMMVVTRQSLTESNVIASYTYPFVQRRLYNDTQGAKGAFVVATNSSWGINYGQPADAPLWCAFYDSLGSEGVLSCGATANLNIDIDVEGDLPTACPSPYMVSVTATDDADNRTFSAYGLTQVDLGAPGDDVYTTSIGGGYGNTSGTSFASPLTAGVIGLLYSAPCSDLMALVQNDPAAGALYVRDALFAGVDQVGNLSGQSVTGGRVNSFNSLQWILNNCGGCPGATDLAAMNTTLDETMLTWDALTAGPFNLQYRAVGEPAWTSVNGLTDPGYLATGLLACTEYEFQVEVDCDTITSGFSASFLWTSEGCCNAPMGLSATPNSETSADLSWDPVLAADSYTIRYAAAGSGNWNSVAGITGTSYLLDVLSPCASFDVQVQSECDGVPGDWSTTVTLNTPGCGACLDLTYCPSVSEESTGEWIGNVSFNTLDNTTGNDGGYGDYTGLSTDLEIGQTYTLSLTPDYPGFQWDEIFTVWMDLDHNGDFDGPGELMYTSPATTNSVTTTVTIPTSATPGSTRMRVIMMYDETAASGCEDGYDYGETEDYCVNLVDLGTGIAPASANGPFVSMFPDPADRDVFFNISGTTGQGPIQIRILDNAGHEVVRKSTTTGRATLTTAWLANGLYFYRVEQDGRELKSGKLVISHYQ